LDKEIEAKIIERIVKDETLKKQVMAMDAKEAKGYLANQGLKTSLNKKRTGCLED